MSPVASPSPGQRYLTTVADLVREALEQRWESIRAAAEVLAAALAAGRTVHTFGTGHSHMLAEELYYRAGGLVDVRPVLFEGLMLHADAPLSTTLERLPGLGRAVIEAHGIREGDVLLLISNSGGNAVVLEAADAARRSGATVVALTSLRHATAETRLGVGARLHDLADLVIDNGGVPGDALVAIEGMDRAVAPTSTALGAALLNALVAETVGLLVEAGVTPRIYMSSNLDGGDAVNRAMRGTP